MLIFNWLLIIILIAAGVLEVYLLIKGKPTISQGMGRINMPLPRKVNLVITISLAVLVGLLFLYWRVDIHRFTIGMYCLIFGHVFGRF